MENKESEIAKWRAKQPLNSGKLWQEMDDGSVDAVLAGITGEPGEPANGAPGATAPLPTLAKAPPAK